MMRMCFIQMAFYSVMEYVGGGINQKEKER